MQALDLPSWLAAGLARCRVCVEWWWWSCVQRLGCVILCGCRKQAKQRMMVWGLPLSASMSI